MWNDIGKHAASEVVDQATSTIASVKYVMYAIVAFTAVGTISLATWIVSVIIG